MFTTDSVSTISSGKIVAQTSTFEQTSMTDDDPGIRIIGDNKVELVYKNRITNEEASIDLYNSDNSSNNSKLYIDNPRGTTSLIIDRNRRLGVGNIVPEAILHIHNHNNSNSEHIRVTNNDNLGMNMILTSSNTDIKANFGIRWYNSGSTTLVNNALVIRNLNGTNTVGIGTSTPSYTLDVSGNINFTGTLTQNGSTFTSPYTLPTASSSTLGGVKIGNNLSINGSGVLSATDTNTTYSVGDGGLTQNNFTNTLKSKLDGIATSANNYSLPAATSSSLGGIKVGNNLSIDSGTGVLSATDTNTTYSVGDGGLTQNNFTDALKTKLDGIATSANNYTLPTAASDTLGGVKVGTNLSIDGNGVLSATDTNTTYSVGDGGLTQNNFTDALKTKLDGIATSANNYSLPTSSTSTLGGVKVDGSTITINGSGVISSSGGGGGGSGYTLPTASSSTLGGIKVGTGLSIDSSTGVLSAGTASSSTLDGQILETLAGVCDGRSVTVESGTYTLPNVTTYYTVPTTSYGDFPGSAISYKPPSDTKQVIYKFKYHTGPLDTNYSMALKFFLGGTEVTSAKSHTDIRISHGYTDDFYYIIDIGNVSTDDIANGKLASWNNLKEMKLQITVENNNFELYVNHNRYEYSGNSYTTGHYVRKPRLTIQAIGQSSPQIAILPTASSSTLGGIKVGTGLTIDSSTSVLSTNITSVGTLSSLTVSGDATFDTSTLKVDSSNNRVGIGTTSPNFRMSFGDGTTNTEWSNGKAILAIHETGGNYFYGLGLGSHDSVNNGGLCLWGGTEGNAPSNSNCHLFIKRSTGRVGIGTTNPVSSLHVKDSLAIFTLETTSGDVNGSYSYISFKDSVGEKAWIGDGSGGDKVFYVYASRGQNIALMNGRVGIGTTTPSTALHIYTIDGSENTGSRYQINSSGGASGSGGSGYLSLRVRGRSWFEDYTFHTSDSRIKKEIEDVPDKLALEQVRNIPCKYYKYVDTYEKGDNKTIGFIAQEVRSVLPMAVSIETSIIPKVYTNILDVTWEEITETNIETVTETNTETGVETNVEKSVETKKYKMRTSTLTNISGVKYRFYVSNTENDEVEKIVTGNDDSTFTFEQQWTNVFCYGYEVEDFHVLDKNKLFALNFSATQELDRIQQQELTKVKDLEIENFLLKERVKDLESKMNDVLNRLAQLENN